MDVVFDDESHWDWWGSYDGSRNSPPWVRSVEHYRLPTDGDYAVVCKAQERLANIFDEYERKGKRGLCPVPDKSQPLRGTLGFRRQL